MAASLSLAGGLFAQEQKRDGRTLTVETKWQGVNFAIYDVQRIQDNRLLVSVRVIATAKAPKEGIVLGEKPAISRQCDQRRDRNRPIQRESHFLSPRRS